MAQVVEQMKKGEVGAVVMWNTNPVYTYPKSADLMAGLEKVKTKISISQYADETATLCKYVAPENHALESWNDFNPKQSHFAIAQPTIRPLFNTRSAAETLMVWAGLSEYTGKDNVAYHDYIKSTWEKVQFIKQTKYARFTEFWSNVVRNSCDNEKEPVAQVMPYSDTLAMAVKGAAKVKAGEWEVMPYFNAGIADGSMAGNPWLQEMPDPVTKVTWDNYFTMAPSDMDANGYSKDLGQESPSTVASMVVDGITMELPVFPQPGQMPGTVGVALGYGRGANGEKIGKSAYQTGEYGAFLKGDNGGRVSIGENAYPLLASGDYAVAAITKTDKVYNLACTQTHSTVMGRNSIVKETTLEIYKSQDASAYNHKHVLHSGWNHDEKPTSEFNLWDEHPVENVGHRWGMTIDLNSCIGCGSCLIACQAENNVPVVGKDEVRRGREMHWIRLDRYYASDIEPAVGTKGKEYETEGFAGLQEPAENPKVVHMPMFCVQCNHAPCETVCPVAATTHSNEGLNMMTYNRCIGTRYCGNNCPYKVRRFNWFNYPSYRKFSEVNPAQDDLGRMVLNPDVVVRTRGVMEKCSFCIQEIQAGKLKAKKEKRPLRDGDVDCACSGACPADAIHFGDVNDINSAVRKSSEDKRSYLPLEEVGIEPNVWFKVKVRNEHNEELEEIQVAHHGDAHHGGGEHSNNSDGHATELSTGHVHGAEEHGTEHHGTEEH
jgi:molybdopterin-containing oxidoreductase family iron-sulfur binding subunit